MAFRCPTSWTDIATAIGTVGAVVVALFGQFLPRLFPPRLQLAIADHKGVRQRFKALLPGAMAPRDGWGRYYQLEVKNTRRWAKARNVQVMFLRLEAETKTGWVELWGGGGIPLKLQHQEALGSTRTLGPSALADLFHVLKLDGQPPVTQLQLTPIFGPLGVELTYAGACGLRVTLQAQGDEADSAQLVVTIRWNGQWDDGADEMTQHVHLEP